VLLLVGCVCGLSAAESAPRHRLLLKTDSLYGTLEVTQADGIRYLFVDGVMQTAMYADRDNVARECHLFSRRYWPELLPYFRPNGKRCLLIGLGGGLLAAVLDGYGVETVGVDVDPKVVEVARTYFGFRQHAEACDGRVYLARTEGQYDFIAIDAFAGARPPFHLVTKQSFDLVKKRLAPDGALALNIVSKPSGSKVSGSVALTLKEVFRHVRAYRTDRADRIQAVIYFASMKPLRLRLHPHAAELGVNGAQLGDLEDFRVAAFASEGVVLTDGYDPLDAEWAMEAAQWRRHLIELFGPRHRRGE